MQKAAAVCVLALSLCLTASARPDGSAPVEHADAKGTPVPTAPDTPPTKVSPPHTGQPAKNDNATTTVVPTKMSTSTKATTGLTTTIGPVTTKAQTTNATTPSVAPTQAPTSTSVAPTTKPTVPSTTEHSTVIPVVARSFDGASFIGGIILTVGLLAVSFMGFKYYKTQTERNYHTL